MTVICPLVDSYISAAARDAGAATELAASCKEVKYAGLDGCYMFAPIVVENLGVPSASTRQLLSDLGRRLTDISEKAAKPVTCFRDAQSWYSALTRFFCMTVCQIVTARISHSQLFADFSNFKPPSGSWLPRV